MTDDNVAWLVQEISDLLDAGQVGLYEFVWASRQRFPGRSASDLLPVCLPALNEIMKDPRVKLGWYEWPPREPIRPASAADLDDHAFDDIGDGPYLGIERR